MMSKWLLEKCHVVHLCDIVKMEIKSTSLECLVVAKSGQCSFPGSVPSWKSSFPRTAVPAMNCLRQYGI